MIIFTILCIIFILSFICFITAAIILERANIRLHTCKRLLKVQQISGASVGLSFLGIGICCFIALIKLIIGVFNVRFS